MENGILKLAVEEFNEQQTPAAEEPTAAEPTTPVAEPAPEPAQAKSKSEDEIVIYAEITDFSGLSQAEGMEHHEQWEIRPGGASAQRGRFRVRKTVTGGKESFALTIKLKQESETLTSNLETPDASLNQAQFDAFKSIAEKGFIKDRYFFPANVVITTEDAQVVDIPDLKWEVDMFYNGRTHTDTDPHTQKYHRWCKIDLEVAPIYAKIEELGITSKIKITVAPSKLPLGVKVVINGKDENPAKRDLITDLYDKYFLTVRDDQGNEVMPSGQDAPAAAHPDAAAQTAVDAEPTKAPEAP